MKIWHDPKSSTGNNKKLKEARETKTRECSVCKITKPWIFLKRNGMVKVFVDENGKRWNASNCRDCYMEKHHKKAK